MDFSEALNWLKKNKRLTRGGWNGKNMYVALIWPKEDNYLPYPFMKTVNDKYIPWLASQTDILAEDWQIY